MRNNILLRSLFSLRYKQLRFNRNKEKSYLNIVNKLKKEGKYNQWVKDGSLLGKIYKNNNKFLKPFKFKNIENKDIRVNFFGKKYRKNMVNIPIFKIKKRRKIEKRKLLDYTSLFLVFKCNQL